MCDDLMCDDLICNDLLCDVNKYKSFPYRDGLEPCLVFIQIFPT